MKRSQVEAQQRLTEPDFLMWPVSGIQAAAALGNGGDDGAGLSVCDLIFKLH